MEKTYAGSIKGNRKGTRTNKGTYQEKSNYSQTKSKSNVYKKPVEKKETSLLVKRGDVFWADLSLSNVGSEQSGVRPVVILQNDVGNKFSPTVIIACITSQIQRAKLPTHVEAGKQHGLGQDSVVLLEQIRTIDKQRLSDKITHFDEGLMKEIDKAMMISLGLA